MANTILEIKNLSKSFGKRKVIDNISLEVKEGEVYGFLGPNGSGKTTTIKMILRLIDNDGGEIKVNGYDTKKQFEKAMEYIGAIVENPDMYKYMTGRDNLKLHARIRNVDSKRIDEVLDLVGLKDRADEKVGKYSLGMKQRLGLALTLLHKPKILVLDEPTNGLDPAGIKQLRDILKEIAHNDGVAVFVSSHILSEMQLMCDKVAVLDNGKIVKTEEITNDEESGIENIEIRVNNKEKAIEILKDKFNMELKTQSKHIEITTSVVQIPSIVKELAINDVGIRAIVPKEHTLEDIFFDATKGGRGNE
ncbi:MAG: ABC transporter ATP-binding protein [Clostridia bacterium]|nr:ABC transporter ATP-binding protein [Clostridia bacterium]